MRIFKWIFLSILIFNGIMILAFGTFIFMLYKDYKMPVEDYETTENSFYKQTDEELVKIIQDETETHLNVGVTEAFLNKTIMEALTKDNPYYMKDGHENELQHYYMYVVGGGGFNGAVKGGYVEVKEKDIALILSVHMLIGNTRLYKTGVKVSLDVITDENDVYYFRIKAIHIGKLGLPLKTGMKIAEWINAKVTDKPIKDLIQENLPIGQFNDKDLSLTVTRREAVDFGKEFATGFSTLIEIIYDKELFEFGLTKDKISMSLALGKVRKLPTDPNKPLFTPITDDASQIAFVTGLNARIITGVVDNPANPHLDLTEVEANQVLDYALKDTVPFSKEIPFKISETETVMYKIESTNLYLTMVGDTLKLHLSFIISRENIIETFDIQLNVNSTISMVDEDIVIEVDDAKVGELELTTEEVKTIVDVYDPDLFHDGKFVISKEQMNEMFLGANMTVEDVEVVNGKLRIYYKTTLSP